jgi:uncharacterized protein
LYDSKHAALYYPWIKIRHPVSGEILSVPPSGHVCGTYARVDVQRGVHKAPANEEILGVFGADKQVSTLEQDILNPLGVNCLREFSGRGLRVWGARTVSNESLWKYINIRRLFLYLEESIEKGTRWVVFESNDEKLWAMVKRAIAQFLTDMWEKWRAVGNYSETSFLCQMRSHHHDTRRHRKWKIDSIDRFCSTETGGVCDFPC